MIPGLYTLVLLTKFLIYKNTREMRVVILKEKNDLTECISVHNDISAGKDALLQLGKNLHPDNIINPKGVYSYETEELFYKRRKTSFWYKDQRYLIVGFNALQTHFKKNIPQDVKERILSYYPNYSFNK